MVQETEKPGVTVAEVCRRHGIATSQLFCWRVQFGLTVRKTPQLAAPVILSDCAVNQVPALSTLRDLARPPDGMTVTGQRSRAAGVMEPRHQQAPQPLIGRLQRAMARNLAI
jgi:transposase-like protein